jgi:hypothetical protein
MRVVILALLFLSVSLTGEAFGGLLCIGTDEVVKVAPQPGMQQNQSSFRGIGLASRPIDVQWRAQSLGFATMTSHYVGDTEVAAVDICAQGEPVGRADFDRQAKMVRLSLKERFFSDTPIFVRRFADDLFERYKIKPSKVDDDVCFQDVTCFKGVSKYGEHFLILRIGTDAELYVSP